MAAGPSTSLGRAVYAHLGSKDVVKVVYGSIVGLALVAALEAHPGTPTQTVAAFVATAIAVALAEAFSEFIGIETREAENGVGGCPQRDVRTERRYERIEKRMSKAERGHLGPALQATRVFRPGHGKDLSRRF